MPLADSGNEARSSARLARSGLEFLRDFLAFVQPGFMRGLLLVGLGAVLENVSIVLLIPLVGLTANEGVPHGRVETLAASLFGIFGAKTRLAQMSVLLALFAVLLLVRALVQSRRNQMLARWRIGFVQSLRLRILRGLAGASWQRIQNLQHARISHVLGGDIDRAGGAAYAGLDGFVAAIMLASQMMLALWLAPAFAGAAMAVLGLATLGLAWQMRQSYATGSQMTKRQLALMHSAGQFLGGLKLAMGQNMQSTFVNEFETSLQDMTRQQVAFSNQQTHSQLGFSTLSILASVACAYVGIGVLDMPVAMVIPLLLVLSRMSGPAMSILHNIQFMMNSLPAYERLRELELGLGQQPPGAGVKTAFVPGLTGSPVIFDNVTFAHPQAEGGPRASARGVRDLSLTIHPGEILGITGPSGSGKTTFADLLVGLNRPQQGTISAGGNILEEGLLTQWREQLSYVSQDAFLFHDSLRRNLLWGRAEASDADIWNALKLAGVDGFVRNLKEGLDTIAGERGILVSGGERQRLALTRALLRHPRLLVLDEATSALDIATERLILGNIASLTPKPTIVVIAHRPESLSYCSRILIFEEGALKMAQASA